MEGPSLERVYTGPPQPFLRRPFHSAASVSIANNRGYVLPPAFCGEGVGVCLSPGPLKDRPWEAAYATR